jgi:quercetin dioxygenase-like cupin family protein
MRISVLLIAGLTMFVSAARAQDPVKVDPDHYKVVLENDQVRVLRIHYGPHEKSVMHHHPGAVAVFLSDGDVKFAFPDGKSQDAHPKAGDAQWTAAQDHLPENLGEKPLDVMLVEVKAKGAATKGSSKSRPHP